MKPIKRKVSNDCRKNDTKVIANHTRNKQCDERITIHIKYLLNAREKSRLQGAIGLGVHSHWLKNWSEVFKLSSPLQSFFFFSCHATPGGSVKWHAKNVRGEDYRNCASACHPVRTNVTKEFRKTQKEKKKKDTCITEIFFRSFSIPAGMWAIVDSVICLCKIK